MKAKFLWQKQGEKCNERIALFGNQRRTIVLNEERMLAKALNRRAEKVWKRLH